jgi:anti-sigma regulatory factor (Ser/Thr protein kinase)
MIENRTYYVLVIGYSEDEFKHLRNELDGGEIDVKYFQVNSLESMSEAIEIRAWDLYLSGNSRSNLSRKGVFNLWSSKGNGVPFIVSANTIGKKRATELLGEGVSDIVVRENLASVVPAIERWLSIYSIKQDFQEKIRMFDDTLLLMQNSCFHFRTLTEARKLSELLALVSPDPERIVFGLKELFFNAVEHGNLGITYEEKGKLIASDKWDEEIEHLLTLPENAAKFVSVHVEKAEGEIRFLIKDQGKGFDWQSYIEVDLYQVFGGHGRGIIMARQASFDRLEYQGCGNEVLAVVVLN